MPARRGGPFSERLSSGNEQIPRVDASHDMRGWFFVLAQSFLVVAFFAVGFRLIEFSLFLTPAQAATYASYDAMVLSLSAPKTLVAGAGAHVTVTMRNIGSAAWNRDGSRFISMYHWDPRTKLERASAFATTEWEQRARAARLPVPSVLRGQEVSISFPIQAPSVPGRYKEEFILTAEDAAWIKNGRFVLDIEVSPAGNIPSAVPAIKTGKAEWSAQMIDQGGKEWQLSVEERVQWALRMKNTGTQTWYRDGDQAVYLYSVDGDKERISAFKDASWTGTRAAKLREAHVKPGEMGTFILEIRAPRAPGDYREQFGLRTASKVAVTGSSMIFPIKIPLTGEFIATSPPVDQSSGAETSIGLAKAGLYATTLLLRSHASISLLGNGTQEIVYGFKNVGTGPWNSRSLRMTGVRPALSGSLSSVRDESWSGAAEPIRVHGVTKVGEIGFLAFRIKGPAKKGMYRASFQLYADEQPVDGGEIEIPITVTADGYVPTEAIAPPPTSRPQAPTIDPIPITGDPASLPDEPLIRVGLYATTDDRMDVRAKFVSLSVLEGGQTLCRVQQGQSVSVSFDRVNRVYRLSGICQGQSTAPYLIRADDGLSAMEISDYSRPVGWLPGANDNTFRAQLELRYTPATDKVWVINELPVEWYLKGIAETSNVSPQQYQRALLTAARTYAMYHVQRGTKHANEHYIVDAHFDQVYRGHGAEIRTPNVVMAVDATRGQIVTYQGKLAVTPYYSRSDGRTRSWGEVWYGGSQYPWLISVPVPWDNGRTLWGHGVGLSASGALGMANDGKNYEEILKYFYSGIELRRTYK